MFTQSPLLTILTPQFLGWIIIIIIIVVSAFSRGIRAGRGSYVQVQTQTIFAPVIHFRA